MNALLGNDTITSLLLASAVPVKATTQTGNTALHIAAQYGHQAVAQELLATEPTLLELPDAYGITPLACAVTAGQRSFVSYLLSHGASVSTVDCCNVNLLHLNARQGDAEITQILLDHGVSTQARDGNGRLPLHVACYEGSLEVVQALLTADATSLEAKISFNGETPVMAAVIGFIDSSRLACCSGSKNPGGES